MEVACVCVCVITMWLLLPAREQSVSQLTHLNVKVLGRCGALVALQCNVAALVEPVHETGYCEEHLHD